MSGGGRALVPRLLFRGFNCTNLQRGYSRETTIAAQRAIPKSNNQKMYLMTGVDGGPGRPGRDLFKVSAGVQLEGAGTPQTSLHSTSVVFGTTASVYSSPVVPFAPNADACANLLHAGTPASSSRKLKSFTVPNRPHTNPIFDLQGNPILAKNPPRNFVLFALDRSWLVCELQTRQQHSYGSVRDETRTLSSGVVVQSSEFSNKLGQSLAAFEDVETSSLLVAFTTEEGGEVFVDRIVFSGPGRNETSTESPVVVWSASSTSVSVQGLHFLSPSELVVVASSLISANSTTKLAADVWANNSSVRVDFVFPVNTTANGSSEVSTVLDLPGALLPADQPPIQFFQKNSTSNPAKDVAIFDHKQNLVIQKPFSEEVRVLLPVATGSEQAAVLGGTLAEGTAVVAVGYQLCCNKVERCPW